MEVDPQFSVMMRRMNIGIGSKRDFLKPGSDDTAIRRARNSCRRSCLGLYLDDERWPGRIYTKVNYSISSAFEIINVIIIFLVLSHRVMSAASRRPAVPIPSLQSSSPPTTMASSATPPTAHSSSSPPTPEEVGSVVWIT